MNTYNEELFGCMAYIILVYYLC